MNFAQDTQTPISNNILKLNNSSFEQSTPGLTSQLKGQLVQFEQFKQPDPTKNVNKAPNVPSAPRNLTIKIDNSFKFSDHFPNKIQSLKPTNSRPKLTVQIEDDKISQQDDQKLDTVSVSSCSPTKQQQFQPLTVQQSDYSSLGKKSKISIIGGKNDRQLNKIVERVRTLQEKLIYYEEYNKRLILELQNKDNTIKQYSNQIRKLTVQMSKRQLTVDQSREKIEYLLSRIAQLQKQKEKQIKQLSQANPKIKQKEHQIKDLTKKNDKLLNINKLLQKQLRESEKKVVQLEKQIHQNTCNNFYENVTRLKQSSSKLRETSKNKQNELGNNTNGSLYSRKSLQHKKNISGVAKTHRANSSNMNILSKKLGHVK